MRTFTLAAVTALGLIAAAHAGPEPTADDLKKELQTLRDDVADLKRSRDVDLKIISDRLDRIERMIERLGGSGSTSRFTPAESTARRNGVVRLDNRMSVTGYVTLDGVVHSVPALSTRTLRDVAVGPISYTLGGDGLSTGPETRSRVNAGERLTITLLPPE